MLLGSVTCVCSPSVVRGACAPRSCLVLLVSLSVSVCLSAVVWSLLPRQEHRSQGQNPELARFGRRLGRWLGLYGHHISPSRLLCPGLLRIACPERPSPQGGLSVASSVRRLASSIRIRLSSARSRLRVVRRPPWSSAA